MHKWQIRLKRLWVSVIQIVNKSDRLQLFDPLLRFPLKYQLIIVYLVIIIFKSVFE